MLPETIELIVVTPEKQILQETVVEVAIPGLAGQLGILPGHAPLMTELGIGELSYRTGAGGKASSIAIIRGFAEVLPDRVTVLAETAERAEEINLQRAEAAKARAEQRISEAKPDLDWSRAQISLERALIRIQVARKQHSVALEAR